MKNFKQPGNVMTMTAPYDVASGGGALVGIVFGVAELSLVTGQSGAFNLTGVVTLPKAAGQVWTAYTTPLYWDNTAKNVTSTAAGNTKIGVATADAISAATSGTVRLNGSF